MPISGRVVVLDSGEKIAERLPREIVRTPDVSAAPTRDYRRDPLLSHAFAEARSLRRGALGASPPVSLRLIGERYRRTVRSSKTLSGTKALTVKFGASTTWLITRLTQALARM